MLDIFAQPFRRYMLERGRERAILRTLAENDREMTDKELADAAGILPCWTSLYLHNMQRSGLVLWLRRGEPPRFTFRITEAGKNCHAKIMKGGILRNLVVL